MLDYHEKPSLRETLIAWPPGTPNRARYRRYEQDILIDHIASARNAGTDVAVVKHEVEILHELKVVFEGSRLTSDEYP